MIEIHTAQTRDAGILGTIHVEGLRSSYEGHVSQNYLDSLCATQKTEEWKKWLEGEEMGTSIAYAQNNPVGFVSYGRVRTPPPGDSAIRPLYTGEIFALYILPDFYRQGIGTQLLSHAATQMREQKHTSMCLWALKKNERATSFYKALGGQPIGKKKVEIGERQVLESCYGWRYTKDLIENVK